MKDSIALAKQSSPEVCLIAGVRALRALFPTELNDELGLDPHDLNELLNELEEAAVWGKDGSLATRANAVAGIRYCHHKNARVDAAFAVSTLAGPSPHVVFEVIACGLLRQGKAQGSPEYGAAGRLCLQKLQEAAIDLL